MDFGLGGDELGVSLAAVERQLEEVRSSGSAVSKDPIVELRALRSQLVVQEEAIERAAGEPAESFLRKFMRSGHRDLCAEDGVLFKQWKKYGDLDNETTLKVVGGILGTMGLTGGMLQAGAIAVTVIVLHLTVKTICEEYGPGCGKSAE